MEGKIVKHVDLKELTEAVEALNEFGKFGKLKVTENVVEMKKSFMEFLSNISEEQNAMLDEIIDNSAESKEKDTVNKFVNCYNAVFEEIEAIQKANKEKKPSPSKGKKETAPSPSKGKKETAPSPSKGKKETAPKEKKEKKAFFESRPALLKRKISEGVKTVDALLVDEEVLKKYDNHKSWIKNDFAKIGA